jgi:hypothetical protein
MPPEAMTQFLSDFAQQGLLDPILADRAAASGG